jgi:hypothetical protein
MADELKLATAAAAVGDPAGRTLQGGSGSAALFLVLGFRLGLLLLGQAGEIDGELVEQDDRHAEAIWLMMSGAVRNAGRPLVMLRDGPVARRSGCNRASAGRRG